MSKFWEIIDKLTSKSEIVIDRPAGSIHPKFADLIYPFDYGYLKNTTGSDGAEIDIWKGTKPSDVADAVLCTIDLLKRNSEIKILIGCTEKEQSKILYFHNNSELMAAIIMKRPPAAAKGKIVIVNGPAGVGKTSIAKALSKYGRNSAVVEGDSIKQFIVNRKVGEVETGLGYINGANVVSNYIKAGYDLAIFEYVFENGSQVPKFMNNLTVDCPVYLFTLWSECNTVVLRESLRENRDRLGTRVTECWETMEKNLQGLGLIVSTEDKTVDEIASLMNEKIMRDEGRIER